MKLSDSFDARRLRPRRPSLALAPGGGVRGPGGEPGRAAVAGRHLGLIGRQPAVGMLHIEPAAGGVLLALGLLSLCLGVFFWRFSRRRSRRNSDLSLSPNLMKSATERAAGVRPIR